MPVFPPTLWTAASGGRTEEARKLLADGADVEEKGGPGGTPLENATTPLFGAAFLCGKPPYWFEVHTERISVVRLLLDHGADTSAQNRFGWTPLFCAAIRGNEEVVHLLLDRGADVAAKSSSGWTPLHGASHWGCGDVARQLLDHGADTSPKDNYERTPTDLAKARAHHKIVAMLKAEEARRGKCVAFAMGQHERLGTGSRVRGLEEGVVRMVLEHV